MRPKKAPAEPMDLPSALHASEPVILPITETEKLAEEILVQYLKLVKTKAEGIDQGKVINADTMNALNMVQQTIWMLHGIGAMKPR
jgi:hypothetical protein